MLCFKPTSGEHVQTSDVVAQINPNYAMLCFKPTSGEHVQTSDVVAPAHYSSPS